MTYKQEVKLKLTQREGARYVLHREEKEVTYKYWWNKKEKVNGHSKNESSKLLEISTTDCKISKPEVLLSRKDLKFAGLGGGHKHRKQKGTWRAHIYGMAWVGHGTVVNTFLK